MSTTMNDEMNAERGRLIDDKFYRDALDRFLMKSHVEPITAAFEAGWDSALSYIRLLMQTPGGDGCFCAHHPDDPAHTKDCYDLIKTLTGR